ncbi:hypothetical protein [Teredinibacter haidensis]|uniref:hypothetical protein n=1 Tax=Teredinibacter haidensis TaxID=2731755 RepID=UPI000948959B|nr:hypothetical protein [Teredinibacter haidensis]
MKPLKTKAQIRAEIDGQINQYLASGGEVNAIESGISGNLNNCNHFSNSPNFQPKQDRTPVTEVIKQVEQRRKQKPGPPLNRHSRPKKKLITDDFGEPLRWVWVE